tara:strand:- start:276 stop:434 length:159 start_codon:yes stop_codon:yes gene_type:complete
MELSDSKKLDYISHVLQEIGKGTIDTEDSVLVEVAIIFINDLKEGTTDGANG